MGLETDTAQGRLILQVPGAAAEHEREIMQERQREGVAKAKAEGKYKGRARTAMAKASEVEALLRRGRPRWSSQCHPQFGGKVPPRWCS
jgi:DNA invertase Pin-like site-specific DNA recombinase